MKLKPILIVFAVVAVAIVGLTIGITQSKSFKVTHHPEVKQEVTKDGRYTAGSPEIYKVNISKSLAWRLTKKNTAVWLFLGIGLLIAAGLFIAAVDIGYINFKAGDNSGSYIAFAMICAGFACYLAAYSSAFANNFKELTPEEYNAVRDNQKAMEDLFRQTDYIR